MPGYDGGRGQNLERRRRMYSDTAQSIRLGPRGLKLSLFKPAGSALSSTCYNRRRLISTEELCGGSCVAVGPIRITQFQCGRMFEMQRLKACCRAFRPLTPLGPSRTSVLQQWLSMIQPQQMHQCPQRRGQHKLQIVRTLYKFRLIQIKIVIAVIIIILLEQQV